MFFFAQNACLVLGFWGVCVILRYKLNRMANNFFSFRQFTVRQDGCAMKVGTDGTLLGAWAEGGKRVLDIGTGTGLIALMMAQRFPDASVTAIDIDSGACRQAEQNVAESPFAHRITVVNSCVQDFRLGEYDAIVCNPPFFVDSLGCPDSRRHIARHSSALSFPELFGAVGRLLCSGGVFSAVVPVECLSLFDSCAAMEGFRCVRRCAVKTVPRKPARRFLVAYSMSSSLPCIEEEGCIEDGSGRRSAWYSQLTAEFYL